ncbi:hypothetical protein D9M71_842830 [compost metagenome]
MAVSGAAVAGHMLIIPPKAAVSGDPPSDGLNAGGFGGFVHHDFFFRHDFVLAAI